MAGNCFINGKHAEIHKGGDTAFSIDITDFLNPSENKLLVKVYDSTDQDISPHGNRCLIHKISIIRHLSRSGDGLGGIVPFNYIKDIKLTPVIKKGILQAIIIATPGIIIEFVVKDGPVKWLIKRRS